MRGLVRPHLSAVKFLRVSRGIHNFHATWFLGQAAPGTPQQLRCFHPGVGQDDQLYLPSTPGTPKSGAPPLSWI